MRRTFASSPALLPLLAAVALGLAGWLIALPANAAAAEAYTNVAWTQCTGGVQGGGSYDADGTFYISCRTAAGKNGVWIRKHGAAAAGTFVDLGVNYSDLAPSPHGDYLYTNGALRRLDRQANGTYKLSTTWKPQTFNFGGKQTAPNGATVATDVWGDIYVSNCCAPNPTFVEKYKADGTLVTQFGDWTSTGEIGKFDLNMGIAVTRDGRSIYTVEKTGGRIQRFDVNPDGIGYHWAVAWGHTDSNGCSNGNFAAPGDAGVDAWGFVYVMDTSCQRIQKFDKDGHFLYSRIVGKATNTNKGRSHKFGVDIDGNVYIPENTNENVVRSTAVPGPWPTPVALPKAAVTATTLAMCPGEDWTNGAGQVGANGTAVLACKTSLVVVADGGAITGRIAMPAGYRYYDVAPSPDWSALYVTRVKDVDPKTNRGGTPDLVRFTRTGAAGSLVYALDAAWKPASFTMGGVSWAPHGRYVATDDYGDLFFSNGGWSGVYDAQDNFYPSPSASAIVEYRPDGTVMTAFHGSTFGEFDVNMGVAVSRDGRTVWEVEHVAGRVERFDWEIDGEYRQNVSATKQFGATDTTCSQPLGFAAPYDLGLDPWGNVYVSSVSCKQVKKFRPDGTLVWTAGVPALSHGIAVDLHGNVYAGGSNTLLKRGDAEDGPRPAVPARPVADVTAPVLVGVTLPAMTATQAITVSVNATDEASGVAKMRLANEDGSWGAWKPFAASSQWTLSAGYGGKGVFVQVMDAAGHESNSTYTQTQYRAVAVPTDTVAPVLSTMTLPASFTGATVAVATVASDNTGVTEMRMANEDGNWGAWVSYAPSKLQAVTAGNTYKVISVQVRDAAGNESATLHASTLRVG